jgi:hypothetical protein
VCAVAGVGPSRWRKIIKFFKRDGLLVLDRARSRLPAFFSKAPQWLYVAAKFDLRSALLGLSRAVAALAL